MLPIVPFFPFINYHCSNLVSQSLKYDDIAAVMRLLLLLLFLSFFILKSTFGETYEKVFRRAGHSCFIDDVYCDANSNILEPLPNESVGLSGFPGFVRFSFCRLLQNQTRTTSFSIHKLSAKLVISWLVGFELIKNAFSNATRTEVSIDVRFFRLRPMASGVVRGLLKVLGPNILWAE